MKNINLIGTELNNLKIINYFTESKGGKKTRQYFSCICFCGTEFVSRVDAIKSGMTKSCGCITGDLISSKNRLPNDGGAFNLVFRNYKSEAKKRHLDFLLTEDEFKEFLSGNCNYCGAQPLLSKVLKNQQKYNRRDLELTYNGVDRVDSNIGYIKGNCVSCCRICNIAKSDSSIEEFYDWINRLIKFNDKK